MNRAPLSIIDRSGIEPDPQPHLASWYTPGHADGLGDRLLMFDNTGASSLELLRFKPEFTATPGFETALRNRLDQLARFDHPAVAKTRAVKWLGAGEGLALVSQHVEGRRLSELLNEARGPSFAIELVRQLAPVIAALERHDEGVGHGLLSPERIVVTPDGRLVIVEAALGPAIQALGLPPDRLRSELGVVVPPGADRVVLDSRADLAQLAWLAISLALGRRMDPAAFSGDLSTLLEEVAAAGRREQITLPLGPWIERALSSGTDSFGSACEAEQALGEYLGTSAEQLRPPVLLETPPAARAPVVPFTPKPRPVERPVANPAAPPSAERRRSIDLDDQQASLGARIRRWAVAAVVVIALGEALVIAALLNARSTPQPVAVASVEAPPAATPPNQPVQQAVNRTARTPERTNAPAAAKPASGGVRVASSIDMQVYERGRLVGSTARPFLLSAGSHELELVNQVLGYRSRQIVEVKPRETAVLSVYPPNGRLSVNASPWAEVWMNGQLVGETPLANLSVPVGSHEIVFKHPQLGVRRQTAVVKPEGLTRVSADFQQR